VESLPDRLYQSLQQFRGQILVILSGADLGAREFMALSKQHAHWRSLLSAPHVRQATVEQANHTFASKSWRDDVAAMCTDWIGAW
jgi:hypothetical protein